MHKSRFSLLLIIVSGLTCRIHLSCAQSILITSPLHCGSSQDYDFPVKPTISDDAARFRALISSINPLAPAIIHFASGNYYFRTVVTSQTGGLPSFNTAGLIENFACGITLLGASPGTITAKDPLGVTPGTNNLYYPQSRPAPPLTTIYFSSFVADALTFFNNTNLVLQHIAINYEDGVTGTPMLPYTYGTVISVNENISNPQLSSFDVQVTPGYPTITAANSSDLTPMFKASGQPFIIVTSTASSFTTYYNINAITLPTAATLTSKTCGSAVNASWAVNYNCPAGRCYHIYPNICPAWNVVANLGSSKRIMSLSGLAIGKNVLILARAHGGLNFISNHGNTFIHNLNIYASPGDATTFTKNEGAITISFLSINPTNDIIRGVTNPLAVNGDGILSLSGHASFYIAYSSFRGLADDPIDINNRMSLFSHLGSDGNPYDRVIPSANGQPVLQLYDDHYSFDYAPGDQISIVDRGSYDSHGDNVWGGILWAGTIQSAILVPATGTVPSHWIITPTSSSPPLIGDPAQQQLLLSSNLALTNSDNGSTIATVRRSTFYPSRGGILLKVPVSNIRFNYGIGAIPPIFQGGADFTNWAEGTVSPLSASGTDVINIEGNVFNAAPGYLVDNFVAPLIEVGAIRSDGGGFLSTAAGSPLITVSMRNNWLNNSRMAPFVFANSQVLERTNVINP